VLLAVTFVAGTFIAIDSSARATFDASVAGIPGDFSLSLNVDRSFNDTDFQAALFDTAGVIDAAVYRVLPVWVFWNTTDHPSSEPCCPRYIQTYAVNPDHLPSVVRNSIQPGSIHLGPGTVALSRILAQSLEVGEGDTVVAVNERNATVRWTANLTVAGLFDVSSQTSPMHCDGGINFPPGFCPVFALVHLREAESLLTQLNQTQSIFQLNGEVWIDRAQFVNPYDTEATQRNLLRIERRLALLMAGNGYVIDNLLQRIEGFSSRIAGQRISYLTLSLPVVLLGVYLGAVGVDLSHAERRRELAILRTRGARRGQIIGLLILEAFVGGLIAAAIGLMAGVGLSRFLLGVVNPESGLPLPYEAFVLTTDTIFSMAALSIFLMGAVAYRSAKRTAGLPVVETLRYYAPGETRIHYNPRGDIILVSLGIGDYVLVWWRSGAPTNLWTFLLGAVPFILLPVIPFLLTLGLTRLLTRSTPKIYDWFSRAAKPFTKDLYYIIRRNLMRNPRRSANIAVIIALGIAFGVFTLSFLAINDAHFERGVRLGIGADMAVIPRDHSTDPSANLSVLAGVAGATKIMYLPVTSNYAPNVYAFDPDGYFAITHPEDWLFRDGSARNGYEVLATDGYVLVSQVVYDQSALEIGDRIALAERTFTRTIQLNVTVGGVVSALPGVGSSSFGFPGFISSGPASIYGSLETMAPFLDPTLPPPRGSIDRVLVDLAPGVDWRPVKSAALQIPNVGFVVVTEEQIQAYSSNASARAISGFIAMEIAFIIVILTAGVGLLLFAASLERDAEFAAIIARGASGWQTAKLLVGEAFVIILVGLTIGAGVGTGAAFVATHWLATGPTGMPTSPIPYFFVFPWEAAVLVALAPGAMLLSALLVSIRTARINVPRVLKLRAG
jgi:ABC-type lipoprotein release transport system permease subunit